MTLMKKFYWNEKQAINKKKHSNFTAQHLTNAVNFGKDEYGGETSFSPSWPSARHFNSCKIHNSKITEMLSLEMLNFNKILAMSP